MFAVPFEQLAPIVERSPEATQQLASRARRRVRGTAPVPDASLTEQWNVVDAARKGDFEALVVSEQNGRPFSVGAFTIKDGSTACALGNVSRRRGVRAALRDRLRRWTW
jgi:hypothetical protein